MVNSFDIIIFILCTLYLIYDIIYVGEMVIQSPKNDSNIYNL